MNNLEYEPTIKKPNRLRQVIGASLLGTTALVSSCTPNTGGTSGSSTTIPAARKNLWVAGDSIAFGLGQVMNNPPNRNAAYGGNGFITVNNKTIGRLTIDLLDAIPPADRPEYITVTESINDTYQPTADTLAAMEDFDVQVRARNIKPIWGLEPFNRVTNPDPSVVPAMIPLENWIKARPLYIDCSDSVGSHRASDGQHPDATGYQLYSDCVSAALLPIVTPGLYATTTTSSPPLGN